VTNARFLVLDNVAAHLVADRRSLGMLSHPLGSPLEPQPLAGEDDTPRSSDLLLIQRPLLKHTVSVFKTH
jgi:hypothetical protein